MLLTGKCDIIAFVFRSLDLVLLSGGWLYSLVRRRTAITDKPERAMSKARQVASIIYQEELNPRVLHRALD